MSVATEFAPTVVIPPRARVGLAHPRVVASAPARVGGPTRSRVVAPAELPGRLESPGRLASVTVLRPPARPDTPPLRLTHRGVIVLMAAVALAALGLVWLANRSAPPSPAGHSGASVVTVAPGDTLWSIAGRVAPDRNAQDEVSRLRLRNHLSGVDLLPGQRLRVP